MTKDLPLWICNRNFPYTFLFTNLFCTCVPNFKLIALAIVKFWPYSGSQYSDFDGKCPFLAPNQPLWNSNLNFSAIFLCANLFQACLPISKHILSLNFKLWPLYLSQRDDFDRKNHEFCPKNAVFQAKIRHYGYFFEIFLKY